MKAIISNHSLFLNATTSAGPLTSAWEAASFPITARCHEASVGRAARRQLRRSESEISEWQEVAARAVLIASMLGAYAAAMWQIAL